MAPQILIIFTLILFAVAWAIGKRIKNYSLVDSLWAYAIGLVSVAWLIIGVSPALKTTAAAVLVAIWSLRLGTHLAVRIAKHHPDEDRRYQKLRETWRPGKFFLFFQVQAVSVLLLALPFYFVSRDPTAWSTWETLGAILALVGILGEALADRQMSQFKKQNTAPDAVCKVGLWRYSRHPNYFFETVIWSGFYLFACGSEGGPWTFYAPLVITFLLLKVTGIPPSEASSLKSKGEAYRQYQRTTSAFILWFPRNEN